MHSYPNIHRPMHDIHSHLAHLSMTMINQPTVTPAPLEQLASVALSAALAPALAPVLAPLRVTVFKPAPIFMPKMWTPTPKPIYIPPPPLTLFQRLSAAYTTLRQVLSNHILNKPQLQEASE